jgi:hypothetical protein
MSADTMIIVVIWAIIIVGLALVPLLLDGDLDGVLRGHTCTPYCRRGKHHKKGRKRRD